MPVRADRYGWDIEERNGEDVAALLLLSTSNVHVHRHINEPGRWCLTLHLREEWPPITAQPLDAKGLREACAEALLFVAREANKRALKYLVLQQDCLIQRRKEKE